MATTLPYYEQKDIENIKKTQEMMTTLPPFCTEFFRGIEPRTSTRTRIAYACDLSVFSISLKKENPVFFQNGENGSYFRLFRSGSR